MCSHFPTFDILGKICGFSHVGKVRHYCHVYLTIIGQICYSALKKSYVQNFESNRNKLHCSLKPDYVYS